MSATTLAPARLGRSFWSLFTSSSASNLSDGILQAALPLLAATLTRDPVAVSTLAALAFVPWLLFALPAGTLVDRVNRRAAMAGANAFRGLAVGLLAVAVIAGHASLPLLYAVAFLLGCAETVYDSAARAILPKVVPRAQLERGNSLLITAESVGNTFLGAPLGAWLFAVAIALPLWVNSTAYLVAALRCSPSRSGASSALPRRPGPRCAKTWPRDSGGWPGTRCCGPSWSRLLSRPSCSP